MKKTFVKVLSVLLVTVAFAVLTGCQNPSSSSGPVIDPLVGTWGRDGRLNMLIGQNLDWFPKRIDLKADGTFSGNLYFRLTDPAIDGWDAGDNSGSGGWSTSDGKITITPTNPTGKTATTFGYSISGNTLTLTVSDGSVEYNKQ